MVRVQVLQPNKNGILLVERRVYAVHEAYTEVLMNTYTLNTHEYIYYIQYKSLDIVNYVHRKKQMSRKLVSKQCARKYRRTIFLF